MIANARTARHRYAALLLMLASGIAGLGYQVVWTQQCALWLGHEAAGVLAVVTAFFAGLAFGSLLLGSRIENSDRPVRWYAACEGVIAAWSLLLTLLMPVASRWLLQLTGVQPTPLWQWTVAFAGTFFLLLPATAAMGATLPAMERLSLDANNHEQAPRSLAALYASNTLGAVIGVLAIAFYLAPTLGLRHTTYLCVMLNAVCAIAALWIFAPIASKNIQPVSNVNQQSRVMTYLAMTGLLGIGYEVLVVRVLSQVAEDTVYTFAMLLAVYLIGSAIGAACYARLSTRLLASQRGVSNKFDDHILVALSMACLLGTLSLWFAEQLKARVLITFGANMTTAISAEALLALVAFGPPTVVMGALFSHLSSRASAAGISFGRALGVNTLGAATAPLIFGVLAYPTLGPKLCLLIIALGYLLLTTWRSWLTPWLWLPASAVMASMIWAPRLAFIEVPDAGKVVSYQEGVMASVSVVTDADDVARLRIDNRQQEGSSTSLRVDARQALLPLLLHPAPTHALFLGLGTSVTASSAAQYPGLQVDAVELLPEVINASAYFRQAAFADTSQLHLLTADARRYVRTATQHYDVIVADNFHPARSGSGSLYTVEHFEAVRDRLASHGIFCQWLPLHQLDLPTLRSIIASFLVAYPHGWAMLASNSLETPVLGLVGRNDDQRFDMTNIGSHITEVSLPQNLSNIGLEDEFALLGSFVADADSLHTFAGDASFNSDDHPVVTYRAPRITYEPDSLPRDRLVQLLAVLSIAPDQLVDQSSDVTSSHRLAAYWNARNQFIQSGRDITPSADVHHMLAQVHDPLLAALRTSPDFRPAYDPLLRMAKMLARTNRDQARSLLTELVQIQPARSEASATLQEIAALR